jgi:glycosyltransferase involved in cell wall biosynthesis
MISGNPVISTVIAGIPDEYFEYLIPIESIDPDTLADKIAEIASMDRAERDALGERSRSYVLENKNNVAQMKKVLEFIG